MLLQVVRSMRDQAQLTCSDIGLKLITLSAQAYISYIRKRTETHFCTSVGFDNN